MEFLVLPTLIFFVVALYNFAEKPHLAVAGILIISLINAWFIEPPSVNIGLNIYLYDVIFIPLLLCAFYRLIAKQEWPYASPLWIGYGLILFYGLYFSIKQYGSAAGVDFRNFFYYWTGTLYFMSFAYSKAMLDRILKYWLLISTVLLLIVYFRFVADFLHLPISATWIAADSTNVRFRVIHSEPTFLLGVTVIILFYRYVMPDWKQPSRILTVLFLVAVIVLQHRSVWAATLLAIASMFFLPGIKKHKLIGKLTVLGVIGMILLMPLLFSGLADNFITTITDSAERATNLSTGTFGARQKGWKMVMEYWSKLDFMHQILGDPFGGGYAGHPRAPHNWFFQALLRVGMLGSFFIWLFYVGLLFRLYFTILKNTEDRLYPTLFLMLFVSQLTYYIPYAPQPEHGILLGIAASLTKRKMTIQDTVELKNTQSFLNTPDSKKFKLIKTQSNTLIL